MIRVENLAKTFTLHLQGGVTIPVFDRLSLTVEPGECVVLTGASGSGKSTLMRLLYANYRAASGRILVSHEGREVDLVTAPAREVLAVRRKTLGYVSQFLRVIPRVPALDVVAEPLVATGTKLERARERARELLARLRLPENLWQVPPMTFSGGEQQRVNIARGFVVPYPALLLDEPTASLDAANRETVVGMIEEARERGAAIVAICHDDEVRGRIATRLFDVEAVRLAA